ncbi:MAG TPA: hypothetical protein VM204_03445 [Gaiellaceae bacterium]|nr:hypothetical protein [Gaiellaceae bacterium]
MDVSLHELTRTRDCKVDGCTWDAVDERGRYAGLCRDHKREAVAAASSTAQAAKLERLAASPNGAITTAAREVLEASKELERALVALHEAEQRRAAATRGWRESVAGLIATTKRYLEA